MNKKPCVETLKKEILYAMEETLKYDQTPEYQAIKKALPERIHVEGDKHDDFSEDVLFSAVEQALCLFCEKLAESSAINIVLDQKDPLLQEAIQMPGGFFDEA